MKTLDQYTNKLTQAARLLAVLSGVITAGEKMLATLRLSNARGEHYVPELTITVHAWRLNKRSLERLLNTAHVADAHFRFIPDFAEGSADSDVVLHLCGGIVVHLDYANISPPVGQMWISFTRTTWSTRELDHTAHTLSAYVPTENSQWTLETRWSPDLDNN